MHNDCPVDFNEALFRIISSSRMDNLASAIRAADTGEYNLKEQAALFNKLQLEFAIILQKYNGVAEIPFTPELTEKFNEWLYYSVPRFIDKNTGPSEIRDHPLSREFIANIEATYPHTYYELLSKFYEDLFEIEEKYVKKKRKTLIVAFLEWLLWLVKKP